MSIQYVCYKIDKSMHYDDYEEGEGDFFQDSEIRLKKRGLVANTLPELLKLIEDEVVFDINPKDTGRICDRELAGFEWDRLEDEWGLNPSEEDEIAWRAGEYKLFNAHYRFWIEKRLTEPVSEEEWQAAGFPND